MPPRPPKVPLRKEAGDYHHGNLRRALLDAAVQLLEEGGDAFTMREAARRVGVDHRAAYKHFEDRDAVLAAVATESYLALVDAVQAELAHLPQTDQHDAEARLLAIARTYLVFATRAPGRYRLMTGPPPHEGDRFPDLERAIDKAFKLIQRELESGMASGVLAKADIVEGTLALFAAMHGMASLVIMRRIRVRKDLLAPFAERTVGCTVRGMLAR